MSVLPVDSCVAFKRRFRLGSRVRLGSSAGVGWTLTDVSCFLCVSIGGKGAGIASRALFHVVGSFHHVQYVSCVSVLDRMAATLGTTRSIFAACR